MIVIYMEMQHNFSRLSLIFILSLIKLQTYSNQNPPRKLILITILILQIVLTSIPPKIDLQHSTSQIIYYLQDKMETQNIEQLLKLAEKYINQGMESVQNPGMTRSGKSTLLNYLLGKKLIADVIDPNAKGKGKKLKIKLENQQQDGQAVIGHQINSETMIPKKYQSKKGVFKEGLFDNPGFADNRGVAIDISNALLISELLKKAINLRFILCVDYDNLAGDNIGIFISLIKTMTQLFNIQNIKNYTCIVFTKVQENYQYEDIIADLEKTITHITDPGFDKELIKYMIQTNRISMFRKPTQKGPLLNQNALQIANNIQSIKPLLKLDLSKVKVSISPQSKNILYSQNIVILQFTKKDLNKFLDYLYQMVKIQKIQTSQQAVKIQAQYSEIVSNKILIKNRENTLKEMVDRLYFVFKQSNLNISDQLMNSIYSKIDLTNYIKKLIQLNTVETDQFQNDISIRISIISKNLNCKILQLQALEGKIQKQQMEAQIRKQEQIQKTYTDRIENMSKQIKQQQQQYAKEMKQLENNRKKQQERYQQQQKQMDEMRQQMQKEKSSPLSIFGSIIKMVTPLIPLVIAAL